MHGIFKSDYILDQSIFLSCLVSLIMFLVNFGVFNAISLHILQIGQNIDFKLIAMF